MPEGPEVRKHAVALAAILEKQKLLEVCAHTKDAKAWQARRNAAKGGVEWRFGVHDARSKLKS